MLASYVVTKSAGTNAPTSAGGVPGSRSRYTHRTAISNERIRRISDKEVAFTVRANDRCGKRLERLEGTEFVRRFQLHVLPTGIKRIRHYGVLACACKGYKLKAARLALQMPAANAQAMESAQGFMARVAKLDIGLCPCCKLAHLQVTAVLPGQARLPTPNSVVLPPGRAQDETCTGARSGSAAPRAGGGAARCVGQVPPREHNLFA